MSAPLLVLYDLGGRPIEVENVVTVWWYENHLSYTVEKEGEEPYNVGVPLHRVYEVRFL